MTNMEKYDRVRNWIKLHPEQSDRQVAEKCGVSPTFVGKVRRYLESLGLPIAQKRQGRDGKRRRLPRSDV